MVLDWLKSKGKDIIDINGEVVRLGGCNYNLIQGVNTRPPRIEELNQIKELGYNCIRLPINWSKIEPRPGKYDENYLERNVTRVIDACDDMNIYVILDFHQFRWSDYFTELNGNGMPIWLYSIDPQRYPNDKQRKGMNQALVDFWEKSGAYPDAQEMFFNFACFIAKKYSDKGVVAMYDLLNEPNNPERWSTEYFSSEILKRFYERMIRRIREVDSEHLLAFEPQDGHPKASTKKPRGTNLVFAPHFYKYSILEKGYTGDFKDLEREFKVYREKRDAFGIPGLIGEFGSDVITQKRWAENTVLMFNKYNFSWTWWCYEPGRGPMCLVDSQRRIKKAVQSVAEFLGRQVRN